MKTFVLNLGWLLGVTLAVLPGVGNAEARVAAAVHEGETPDIVTLLAQDALDEVDQRLNMAQARFEKDPAAETSLHDSFSPFTQTRGKSDEFDRKLTQWVEAKPGSYAAHLARGIYSVSRGLAARGQKYARDTSAQQMIEMERWLGRGREDLVASLALSDKPLLSHIWLLNAAMRSGSGRERSEYFLAAAAYAPRSIELRSLYMMSLEPRWGGSYEKMEAFARESESLLGAGRDSDRLWNMIAIDRGHVLLDGKKFKEAHELVSKALARSESPRLHCMRAAAGVSLNRWREAMDDMNATTSNTDPHDYCAGIAEWMAGLRPNEPGMAALLDAYLQHNPDHAELHRQRGWIRQQQKDMAGAFTDYAAAAELGDTWSQTQTGRFLFNGWGGVTIDREKALSLFETAAQTGDADAQLCLTQALQTLGRTEEVAQLNKQAEFLKRIRPMTVTQTDAMNAPHGLSYVSSHRVIATLLGAMLILLWLRRGRRSIQSASD